MNHVPIVVWILLAIFFLGGGGYYGGRTWGPGWGGGISLGGIFVLLLVLYLLGLL